MSLKLYEIETTLTDHPDCTAGFKKIFSSRDILLFFVSNIGDEDKIKRRNLEFVAGSGYSLKNIVTTDYIYSPTALLFSKRFVEKVGDLLKEEMKFFPCQVICQDSILEWYAAKISHYLPLIDKEQSIYRTLTDGEKVLRFAKYKQDITEPFYIARDNESFTDFVVSELFLNLCKENDIMINFKKAGYNSSISNELG